MSQAIMPLPTGLSWNVVKRSNWSTIVQRSASGREVRSPLYVSPIWEWELNWERLADYASPRYTVSAAPANPTLSSVGPGSGFSATTYYVVITYMYPDGETLSSNEVSLAVSADEYLKVDSPTDPGDGAIGWNCYVGLWSGGEVLQLSYVFSSLYGSDVFVIGPIPIGTNWQENSDGLSAHTNDPSHYFTEPGTSQDLTPPPISTPTTFADTDSVYTFWQKLLGFYNARQGPFDDFLFADQTDSFLFNPIGVGDGSNKNFQITKTYNGFTEAIKDILGPTTVSVDGTTLTSGYTVSATGLISLTTAPAAGKIVDVATSFFRRVRFADDNLEGNNFLYNLFELKKLNLRSVKI